MNTLNNMTYGVWRGIALALALAVVCIGGLGAASAQGVQTDSVYENCTEIDGEKRTFYPDDEGFEECIYHGGIVTYADGNDDSSEEATDLKDVVNEAVALGLAQAGDRIYVGDPVVEEECVNAGSGVILGATSDTDITKPDGVTDNPVTGDNPDEVRVATGAEICARSETRIYYKIE